MSGHHVIGAGAYISECGRFRYALERHFMDLLGAPSRGTVCFVMLNPSTADAFVDDPTIRRCVGFARTWGFGSLVVVNLYAFRATKPDDLAKAGYPIGPENDQVIGQAVTESQLVVAAWGASAEPGRVTDVRALIKARGKTVHHLGLTKSGAPRHPLYVRADREPEALAA